MKTLYVLMVFAAAMATVAAFPPLGSLIGLPSFGGAEDTYDDYEGVDPFSDGGDNSTASSTYSSDTSDTSYESTTPSTSTTTETPDDGLSGGAIAGIVIGSLAGVALIAGGVYYMKVKGMLCFK